MKTEKPSPPKTISLEQVLQRGDVWRGHSQHLVPQAALDTGCTDLNVILVNRGWPLASLIEVCLPMASKATASVAISQGEWLLIAPALRQVKEGYTVLLNPPAIPFAPGLIQIGMDLDRLIVVETNKKSDFLASFIELARSDICRRVGICVTLCN